MPNKLRNLLLVLVIQLAAVVGTPQAVHAQQRLGMLKNVVTGTYKCLIFSGDGGAAYPSLFDWGAGNDFCGFPGGQTALLANKQAVWKLEALDTEMPGDRYMVKNASDGSGIYKCLVFGNGGHDEFPSRYDWGAGNDFCGFPGGKPALLRNEQAIWHLFAPNPTNPLSFLLQNASEGGTRCLFIGDNGAPPSRAPCPPTNPGYLIPPGFLFSFVWLN
jgi:hypothetical protein